MKELQQTADAVLERSIKLEVDILHPTWLQKLRKEKKKVFHVKPLTLGTLIRISKELLSIDVSLDKSNALESSYKIITSNAETAAKIVALAVTNSKLEPSAPLVNFFLYNLTSKELAKVMYAVLVQMDTQSFIHSIASVRQMNVLQTASPKAPDNQVSGQPLED